MHAYWNERPLMKVYSMNTYSIIPLVSSIYYAVCNIKSLTQTFWIFGSTLSSTRINISSHYETLTAVVKPCRRHLLDGFIFSSSSPRHRHRVWGPRCLHPRLIPHPLQREREERQRTTQSAWETEECLISFHQVPYFSKFCATAASHTL